VARKSKPVAEFWSTTRGTLADWVCRELEPWWCGCILHTDNTRGTTSESSYANK
jgi:hypothetical protein